MTPQTLQALRRLLFFSRPEAAALLAASEARPAGVSDRAWRMWEDGERTVPEDVAQKILEVASWRNNTLAIRKEQITQFISEAGEGNIVLVWYESLDDWATLPDRNQAIYWRPLQSVIADLASSFPQVIQLIQFDPVAYAAWLGRRADSETMRSRWAAEKAPTEK